MKKMIFVIFVEWTLLLSYNIYGQSHENCFLDDFESKNAEIPRAVNAVKPAEPASVTVTITGDTLGKISKYVFGNAIAAWAGAHNNPELLEGVNLLAPTLVRFPGGSWSNGYFWNKKIPSDVPGLIYDGTTYDSNTKTAQQIGFTGHCGTEGWVTTTEQYYAFRRKTNVRQGLITINYGYARYGTSGDPAAQAAHLAADWVRYDKGATKFWEIGNENGGPWEYGWMIDTAMNKDGQPEIITGELYGKHFKVFADSMKKAAEEIGSTIYIGGQVLASKPSPGYMWYFVDKTWNEGFFKEAGNSADFYVMHNYFSSSTKVKDILDFAVTEPKKNIDFIRQNIIDNNAYPKPVALTEYNMGSGSVVRAASYINGMQAVVLICEMIKNNFGMGARWLLISGESTMFYGGSDADYSNHPHAEFYYLTYLQKFYGDHAISSASSHANILCYASRYASGETGVIIINKGTEKQIIKIDTGTIRVGQHYYVYSFTGGKDNGDFSQNVYINGHGPSPNHWGPFEELSALPADSYTAEKEIKLTSPARSVQMIIIEGANNSGTIFETIHLHQNYPNPFKSSTLIEYQLPASVSVVLKVFNVLGKEVETLVDESQNAGNHSVQFNASNLPNGLYFYRLEPGMNKETRKLMVLR
jgi:hypothetical protein